MTPEEINTLTRPYLLRQQAREQVEMQFCILAILWLCILATAFGLTLAFVLNS